MRISKLWCQNEKGNPKCNAVETESSYTSWIQKSFLLSQKSPLRSCAFWSTKLVCILKVIPHAEGMGTWFLPGINTTCHVLLNIQRLHLHWRIVTDIINNHVTGENIYLLDSWILGEYEKRETYACLLCIGSLIYCLCWEIALISPSLRFLQLISEEMHTVPYGDWFKSWKLESMLAFPDAQLENTLKPLSIESTARTAKRKRCFLNFQVWGSRNGGINNNH